VIVGPPSVIFAERQSQPEIVPRAPTAERSAHMARHRSKTLMLGAMVMVGVAGAVVGTALYFGGAGDDDEEALGADAGSRALLGGVMDAASAAEPPDAPPARTPPDAAVRRGLPDARPVQVLRTPPDAAVRVVTPPPPPRRTISVTVLTDPPEGVIFQGDRQLPDRTVVKGLEGTQTEVRCEMFKREKTTISIKFDRDKTVFCRMPELKDPFERVKEPDDPKQPLKEYVARARERIGGLAQVEVVARVGPRDRDAQGDEAVAIVVADLDDGVGARRVRPHEADERHPRAAALTELGSEAGAMGRLGAVTAVAGAGRDGAGAAAGALTRGGRRGGRGRRRRPFGGARLAARRVVVVDPVLGLRLGDVDRLLVPLAEDGHTHDPTLRAWPLRPAYEFGTFEKRKVATSSIDTRKPSTWSEP
jgi:hypothetical protein